MQTSTIEGGDAATSMSAGPGSETMCEEMQKEHNTRRAKLTQDLNNLNKMLGMKEDLVNKMKASDKNMEDIKSEYEVGVAVLALGNAALMLLCWGFFCNGEVHVPVASGKLASVISFYSDDNVSEIKLLV